MLGCYVPFVYPLLGEMPLTFSVLSLGVELIFSNSTK